MRATAKIEPFALIVDFQVLTFRDRINEFDLIALAFIGKTCLVFSRDHTCLVNGLLR